ncbi:16S rRNA (uracil(1498)-N(3))-methyltransferase [Hyphobacterium sp.]|uniref:16S rRNA (uracil(1498)-N(3))-methyltransferase n=1 Tax=Hyphobacterium sp. TaxID=2004662 RepID=UPI003BA8692E
MSDPRLYCDQPLSESASIALGAGDSHYLVSVMRRTTGDGVRLFNAEDGEWQVKLSEANRKAAVLTVQKRLRAPVTTPDVELCFAPVKKNRTNFIVEKATELGVRRIVPVMTQRTIAQTVRTDRMMSLAKEAAEQTERLDLPEIGEAEKLKPWLDQRPSDRTLIFCDEAGDAAPMADTLNAMPGQSVTILIGPEGGFTPDERDLIRSQPGALAVSLGPRILRADTAVAAALTLYQALCGDWRAQAQGRD